MVKGFQWSRVSCGECLSLASLKAGIVLCTEQIIVQAKCPPQDIEIVNKVRFFRFTDRKSGIKMTPDNKFGQLVPEQKIPSPFPVHKYKTRFSLKGKWFRSPVISVSWGEPQVIGKVE